MEKWTIGVILKHQKPCKVINMTKNVEGIILKVGERDMSQQFLNGYRILEVTDVSFQAVGHSLEVRSIALQLLVFQQTLKKVFI